MFYSGNWIFENGNKVFTPFKRGQIDCNAYTMTIGSEIYTSPENNSSSAANITQLHTKEPFTIRSGQFAFLITSEYVTIPVDIIAFINLKNSLKVQGLINVSGFHVDPGYDGKLIFAVFNAGPKSIILREGDHAFLIWLARIEDPSTKYAKSGKGFTEITSTLAANIPRESVSVASLNAKVEKIERLFWIAVTAAPILLTIVLSILVPIVINALKQR